MGKSKFQVGLKTKQGDEISMTGTTEVICLLHSFLENQPMQPFKLSIEKDGEAIALVTAPTQGQHLANITKAMLDKK